MRGIFTAPLHARTSMVMTLAAAAIMFAPPAVMRAQQPPSPNLSAAPVAPAGSLGIARVDGQIIRVTADGESGVARQWVVLHGIGSTGGRAIDSTRTIADGSFALRYDRGTDSTAQYFVTTVHHGIAYVSGVLSLDAGPEEATLTVFDTTSAPVPLTVRGRHLLIFAPDDSPNRRVAEIYELSNDTVVTRVTADSATPLWTASVPAGVQDFSSGPELMSNESIRLVNGRVAAYAPIAPGLKRIAFTYSLPPGAFPLSIPLERPTDVFEVMLEDSEGAVTGPGLEESAPANIEGHVFRRFQAQGIAAASVVTVRVPAAPAAPAATNTLLVVALSLVMIGALVIALRRARRRATPAAPVAIPVAESDVDALAREIATLDAAFEAGTTHDDAARAHYAAERDRLKRRLAERLAANRQA